MPNAKVDEGEIALIIGEGGLKPATLARRKRIRAHFQAFTVENYEKDLTELINGPKEDISKAVCAFLSTLCVYQRLCYVMKICTKKIPQNGFDVCIMQNTSISVF